MTEVEIKIAGFHLAEDNNDNIEFVTAGTYYAKDGKHYILYEETAEGGEKSKTILKIGRDTIELIKRGYGASHIIFTEGRIYKTFLRTIAGNLEIETETTNLSSVVEKNCINAHVEYSLQINQVKTADCKISIQVNAKEDLV